MTTETPPRPPDHPIVPRRGPLSIFTNFLLALGLLVVAGYAAFAYSEREIGGPEHGTIPTGPHGVRTSPGGYRSYGSWHSGFHGGK
jgi:hypothetical protein